MTWPHGEIDFSEAERVAQAHLSSFSRHSSATRSVHQTTVGQFLTDLCERRPAGTNHLAIDGPGLIQWMARDSAGRTVKYAAERLRALRRFLEALHDAGVLAVDPFVDFQVRLGQSGCESIAKAVQTNDPASALAALEPKPNPPGPLQPQITTYLELHRALGKKYRTHAIALKDLNRFLRKHDVPAPQDVTPALVQQWAASLTCGAGTRVNNIRFARRFFDHLRSLNVITTNPVVVISQDWNQGPTPVFHPFIFTKPQIASILVQARRLPSSQQFPFRAEACHTMLVLLYGLGLRHGEALRLQLCDLDLVRQTLFIRETKFHKSRYVPFGPKIGQCLEQFLNTRRTLLVPAGNDDPLFVTTRRAPVSHHSLMRAFRSILRGEGIMSPHPPRLHDLRHSFAVHRLLRWYREGVDVQSWLPALSTFLGHVDVTSTQVYLTITIDLLREANDRFDQHFGRLFDRAEEETVP